LSPTTPLLGFEEKIVYDTAVLGRLAFICLSAHTLVWVDDSVRGVSMLPFRRLSAVSAARAKVISAIGHRKVNHSNDKGWPGRCQPHLVFALQCKPEQVKSWHEVVTRMVRVCDLTGGGQSSARNTICRNKVHSCSVFSRGVKSLAGLVGELAPLTDPFEVNDWLLAANFLAVTLKLTDQDGLVGALSAAATASVGKPVSLGTLSGNKGDANVVAPGKQKASKPGGSLASDKSTGAKSSAVGKSPRPKKSGPGVIVNASAAAEAAVAAAAAQQPLSSASTGEKGSKSTSSKGRKSAALDSSNLGLTSKASERAWSAHSTAALARLGNFLRLEEQFSKSLFDKYLPRALDVYSRGLPPRYNSIVHAAHVNSALMDFRRISGGKGAVAKQFERKLMDQCKRIWRGTLTLTAQTKVTRDRVTPSVVSVERGRNKALDRRSCDSVSLSGRPCINLYRECAVNASGSGTGRSGRGAQGSSNGGSNMVKCSSGVKQTVACLCGSSCFQRDDPFEADAANSSCATAACCAQRPHCFLDKGKGGRKRHNRLPRASDTMALQNVSATPTAKHSGASIKSETHGRGKIGAWTVFRLGPASSYHPGSGLEYDGFAPGYNRLEPWPEAPVYVGLEYECISTGVRQIFMASSLSAPSSSSYQAQDDDRLRSSSCWPEHDVDLFLSTGSDGTGISQLQRIFVNVGPEVAGKDNCERRVQLQAQVHFEGGQLFTHRPVVLPPDSLVTLALPHVYVDTTTTGVPTPLAQAQPSPGSRFRSSAKLKCGLLSFASTSTKKKSKPAAAQVSGE